MRASALLMASLVVCVSCDSDNGPTMRPGEDCLVCHDGGDAPKWSAAGTVFAELEAATDQGLQGVTIEVTDTEEKTITLVSNAAGNFFTAEKLVPPFDAAVDKDSVRLTADEPVKSGACNSCHTIPPEEDTEGRLYWAAD